MPSGSVPDDDQSFKPPIEPGQPAPDFHLPDQTGRWVRLRDLLAPSRAGSARRWVVLYFYPRDNTPGCTTEACGFRDRHSDFKRQGAVVVGLSTDGEASHAKFAHKLALPFTLLADVDAQAAMAYGVWQQKKLYGKAFVGIVRTTFLIDPQGRVAHRWDRVKSQDHEAEVLAKLREMRD
ncbi:MAG: thioredoxin-dependent thiol peroxidase [Verrucomicrobiae bacterium]|nr:thioredoxin-dependent thiol peroxidase [Verrucomicrobiae bacterium]